MATKILINTVRYRTDTFFAGTSFDTVAEADTIANVMAAGGQLVDAGDPFVDAAAALALELRKRGGPVSELDGLMLSATANSAKETGESALAAPVTFTKEFRLAAGASSTAKQGLFLVTTPITFKKLWGGIEAAFSPDDTNWSRIIFTRNDLTGGTIYAASTKITPEPNEGVITEVTVPYWEPGETPQLLFEGDVAITPDPANPTFVSVTIAIGGGTGANVPKGVYALEYVLGVAS